MTKWDALLSRKSDEYSTPSWLYDQLNDEFSFTLDPCATDDNHKCEKYFTKDQDGLNQSWAYERVFCNPPYSKISEWVRDDILAGILDYRAKNELLTYITSSYTIDELISLYNVTKTGASDVGRIKANKFVERVKSVCPKQIVIEGK